MTSRIPEAQIYFSTDRKIRRFRVPRIKIVHLKLVRYVFNSVLIFCVMTSCRAPGMTCCCDIKKEDKVSCT